MGCCGSAEEERNSNKGRFVLPHSKRKKSDARHNLLAYYKTEEESAAEPTPPEATPSHAVIPLLALVKDRLSGGRKDPNRGVLPNPGGKPAALNLSHLLEVEVEEQDVTCSGKGKPHVVDFALFPEDRVCKLEEWVRSLVKVKKEETGVGYEVRHVLSLLNHIEKVLKQVEGLLEKGAEEAGPWVSALENEDASVAYEHVVAAALYTHGMSCEKKKDGLECTHTDCDQRVSLYEVMNAAMRGVGQCARTEGRTLRELVEEVDEGGRRKSRLECGCGVSQKIRLLASFQPLVVRLQGLMRVLPKVPRVVFRGMGARVAHLYKVGGQEVWSGFSSTSDNKEVAQSFADGTMFAIATCEKAADIEFGNAYEEKEVLYAPNTVFNVAWKLSPTLLRMLGLRHDVVVLTEEPDLSTEGGSKRRTSLRLRALQSVMQHTAGYFADFVENTYVEGRVAGEAHALPKDTTKLRSKIAEWMEGEEGCRSPLCLLGDGGTGKTSAALAVVGWLLEGNKLRAEKKENGVPEDDTTGDMAEDIAGSMAAGDDEEITISDMPVDDAAGLVAQDSDILEEEEEKEVFPVFVPLPVLKGAGLLAAGGLDAYVQKSFGLQEGELEALSSQFDVVLVLDSLDEVGLAGEELLDGLQREGKESLLSLHPWCSSCCSVILTTRGEYLRANRLAPSDVCGRKVETLHFQPFSWEDVSAYVRNAVLKAHTKILPMVYSSKHLKSLCAFDDLLESVQEAVSGGVDLQNNLEQCLDKLEVSELDAVDMRFISVKNAQRAEVLEDFYKHAPEDAAAYTAIRSVMNALKDREFRKLVSNPFVLHMAVAGRRELGWMAGQEDKPPAAVARVEVYEAYLRGAVRQRLGEVKKRPIEDREVERVLAFGELLGCWMLNRGAWAGSIEEVRRWLEEKGKRGELVGLTQDVSGLLDDCLQSLPLRVESVEDSGSTFTFTHKTVGEYLAGRRLWRSPCETLTKLLPSRRFSKEAPNVLGFFSALGTREVYDSHKTTGTAATSKRGPWDSQLEKLLRLVELTSDTLAGGVALVAGSNAMSLLCHGGFSFPEEASLRGVRICGADLRNLVLGGVDLSGAVLRDNWMDGSIFHRCDLTRTDWEGSSFGVSVPPMRRGKGVRCVAVTPDGKRVVAACDAGVKLWDLASWEVVAEMEGGKRCEALKVTPDGRHVVGATWGWAITWDLASGDVVGDCPVQPLDCHVKAHFTNDGRHLVSGSQSGHCVLADHATGEEVLVIKEPKRRMQMSAIANHIVYTSCDNSEVHVTDLTSGEYVCPPLQCRLSRITALAVTHNGERLVAAGEGGMQIWEPGRADRPWNIDKMNVSCIALSPDGKFVAAADDQATIRVWDLASESEVVAPLQGHTGGIACLAVTPDCRRVVSGGWDNTLRVWDLAGGKEAVPHAREGHRGAVSVLSVMPDGRRVVSVGADETLRVWDVVSGKEVMRRGCWSGTKVTFTQDGGIWGANTKTRSDIYDLVNGRALGLGVAKGVISSLNAWALSWSGVLVWSALKVCRNKTSRALYVWDFVNEKMKDARLVPINNELCTLKVTRRGQKAVGIDTAKNAHVWDLATGGLCATFAVRYLEKRVGGCHETNTNVILSGQKLVTHFGVWDLSTGMQVIDVIARAVQESDRGCLAVCGKLVASSFGERNIHIWDIDTGEDVVPPLRTWMDVHSIALTPDEKVIVGSDSAIYVWDLEVAPLSARININKWPRCGWHLRAVWGSHTTVKAVGCTGVHCVTPKGHGQLFDV